MDKRLFSTEEESKDIRRYVRRFYVGVYTCTHIYAYFDFPEVVFMHLFRHAPDGSLTT